MTSAVAQLLEAAERLSAPEQAELTDLLVARFAHDDIPPEIEAAQIAEVQRRIAQVESGETKLIPGEQVMAEARQLLASLRAAKAN